MGGLSNALGKPSIFYDFTNGQYGNSLSSISLTRNSTAYFRGGNGFLLSAGNNVQRFQHDNNLKNLGLFCEGVNQNVCLQSENLGTTWTNTNTTESLNVVATTDPAGGNTADKLEEDSATGEHRINQTFTGTSANQLLTFSIWVKASERNIIRLQLLNNSASNGGNAYYDLTGSGTARNIANNGTGTSTSAGIEAYPDGWYLCRLTTNPNDVDANSRILIYLVSTGTTTNYAGNTGSGVFLWGAQLQVGNILTSYIPTTISAVSSTADNYLLSNISSLIKQGEGTIFAKAIVLGGNPVSRTILSLNDGTVNNAVTLRLNNSGLGNLFIQNGGASQVDAPAGTGFMGNIQLRIAASYRNGVFSIASNGSTFSTTNTGVVPSGLDRISLGCLADGSSPMNGHLQQIAYWPYAASETALGLLTRA